jgi:hypothetical protein
MIPILLVQRHNLERQTVAMGNERTHLNVLLGTAVALVIIHSDADIKQVQVLALLLEPVDNYSAVNATRYQYRYTQFIFLKSSNV